MADPLAVPEDPLSLSASLLRRHPDVSPIEPGWRAPQQTFGPEGPASPEFYRTTGVDPLPAMRERLRGDVARMHEANRRPDPLETVLDLGGGPAGSALAMATAPGRRALAAESAGALRAATEAFRTPQGQAARALKGEGGRGIASVNLRGMTQADAIAQARTEQHLIGSTVREGFVGGPGSIRNRADLARARAAYDADVETGISGAYWYSDPNVGARAGTAEMAGPDPTKQSRLANELAHWSSKATPETNLGFAIQGHNAWEAGQPLDLVYTTAQAERYNAARAAGTEVPLGSKTAPYGGAINPAVPEPVTGVHDVWDARAWGYNEQELKNGLHAHQHAFLDAEGLLAVDRANKKKLGGRSDWTAGQVQASAWVAGKGRGLAEAKFKASWDKLTPEQRQWGLDQAAKSYPEYFSKHTAHGTYEATPYVGSGQLPELVKATYADKASFMNDPRRSWTDPAGRDVLYETVGMYQRPTKEATGIYTPPGGTQEINPARVARPMVSFEGDTGDRRMGAASRAMMQKVEGVRSYMDVQGAGAGSIPIFGQKAGVSQSVLFPHEGPLSLKQIESMQAGGGKHGLPDVIDYGEGAVIAKFPQEEAPLGKDVASALRKDPTLGLGMGKGEPVKLDSIYVPMFETGTREGSGEVTRTLQAVLTDPAAPATYAKLDASPAVRQAARDRFEQNAEYGLKTRQYVRADVQRALDIISREGFSGLFAALQKGAALPVALLAAVPVLRGRDE